MTDTTAGRFRAFSRTRIRPLAVEGFCVVAVALALMLVASHLRSTNFNNYVRLADAMRHGHLWIEYPGRWLDAVAYKGKHYGVDAPFPALLCLPFVLIWGADANQTLVAIGVATLGLFAAWRLLVTFGVARVPRIFLMMFLFAGTDYWWCAELGDVWFFAHLCAATAIFCAMLELCGARRAAVVALLAVAAIESRNTLVLALPFLLWMYATGGLARAAATLNGRAPTEVAPVNVRTGFAQFGAIFAATALLWVAYNEAMWGTLVDIGHTLYYHQDSFGSPAGSPFGLRYVPYQLYSFFVRGPEFVEWLQVPQWPYLKVNPSGVALTFTSPALVLTVLARRPAGLVRWLWVTTALVAVPDLLYYLNGWYQFGMRHALDFMPFLFLLLALAVRTRMPRWGMALVIYSALAGTWGVWWWNAFMRTGN